MVYQKGGQLNEAKVITKNIVKTSGDIVKDLADGMVDIIGGFTNGLETIANVVGETINNISKTVALKTVQTSDKVGDFTFDIAKELGKVVKVVPLLGHPIAYVVEGTGKGVYYIVTSVGTLVGKGIQTVGTVSKGTTKLVVFTVATTSDTTESIVKEAGNIVSKIADKIANGKLNKRKTKKISSKKY